MNVKVEAMPHSQSQVTVDVEPERVVKAKEEAFRRVAREAVIPGFRKGKAPRNLVGRYVNPEVVEEDAETHLMEEIWHELLTGQFKDTPLFDSPRVKVTQHNPLIFEITLTRQPTATIGAYSNIRIAPELVTVTDSDVTETLDKLREEQAQWQPVEHRPVRKGDMVTVTAHGVIGTQPIVLPENHSLVIDESANFIVPGFAMRLIDMEPGVEKEFSIQVPDDAPNKEMAGATGSPVVTVQEIKEKVLPALDDAFAKTLHTDDVAALTERVRSSLLNSRQDAARGRMESRVLDEIATVSTVEFPDVMTEQHIDSMIADRTEYLKSRGIEMELYMQITKMTREQMRGDLRPDAEKRIRNYLLVEELGRAEGIIVEDGVVHAEINRVVAVQPDQAAARSQLSTNEMHDRIKNNLFVKALFDNLIAKVTEGQEPVLLSTSTAMPSPTDSIVTSDEPAASGAETPKIVIATH